MAILKVWDGSEWIIVPSINDDHGTLSGLDDDDHTQYLKTDGTRPITGVQSGVTPTAITHLTTKDYTDKLGSGVMSLGLSSTPSSTVFLENPWFTSSGFAKGFKFNYAIIIQGWQITASNLPSSSQSCTLVQGGTIRRTLTWDGGLKFIGESGLTENIAADQPWSVQYIFNASGNAPANLQAFIFFTWVF